jgi:ankyrin repeat protein
MILSLKSLRATCIILLVAAFVVTPYSYAYTKTALDANPAPLIQQRIQQSIATADSEALAGLLQSLPQSEIQQSFTLENPLVLAMTTAERCSPDLLDVLIAADAPSYGLADGNALHYVGYFSDLGDNLNCLNKLLAVGIDINQQDKDGYTPLVKLLYSQSEHTADLISYMLKQGANPLIRSQSGMDFLHHALALQLLYSEQLYFLAKDDPFYLAANKMVTTAQLARKLYAEYYLGQHENKVDIGSSK